MEWDGAWTHQIVGVSYENALAWTRAYLKATTHVGTDQNFEIEIFAEYKYTLNELLVKKTLVFQYV